MTDTPPPADRASSGLEPRDAARARRHHALRLRRDLRGAVPHPELRLRQRRAGRGALQERGRRLHLQPLRQPHRRHVRGAHAAAGGRARRRAPPPPAWPPSPPRCCATSRPATTSSPRAPCSARAATWWRTCCPRFGIASTLVDGRDLDAWRAAVRPNTQAVFFETPANPDPRPGRHRRRVRDRPRGRRPGRGRQRVRHAHAAEAAQARRRRRRLFRHQAHRRPGPLPWRHRAGLRRPS